MDGEGLALVIGGGPECSVSFPWEASFSFGAFGGPEVGLEVAFFPWEASFFIETRVGSEIVFVVPMFVG